MPEIPEVVVPEPKLPDEDFDPNTGAETGIITVEDNTEDQDSSAADVTWLESILQSRVDIDSNHPLYELRQVSDEALEVSAAAEVNRKIKEDQIKAKKAFLLEQFKQDTAVEQDDMTYDENTNPDDLVVEHIVDTKVDTNDGHLPLPNRRLESWRFTDLRSLYGARYTKQSSSPQADVDLSPYVSDEAGIVLAFVDGVFNQKLSQLNGNTEYEQLINANGFVGSVNDYKGDVSVLKPMFTKAELGDDIKHGGGLFPAIGNAITSDVAVVDIPKEYSSSAPIAICFISTCKDSSSSLASVSAPRLLVRAGSRSSLSIVEYHISDKTIQPAEKNLSSTKATVFSGCAVHIDENATLSHYVVNYANDVTSIVGSLHAVVEANSTYKLRQVGIGGYVGRLSGGIELIGNAATADIKGLSCTDGNRVQDFHSRVCHNSHHTRSNQIQKNVATGKGRAVFCGKIIVTTETSDTDSQQLSKSLILSEGASIDAMPTLEIANDDVQCSHGATVSDLSEDELFYCRSRGLTHIEAQSLIILGFVGEVLGDCPLSAVANIVRAKIEKVSEASKARSLEGADFSSV